MIQTWFGTLTLQSFGPRAPALFMRLIRGTSRVSDYTSPEFCKRFRKGVLAVANLQPKVGCTWIHIAYIQSHNNHNQPSQSDFEKNMTIVAQRKELRKGNC